MLKVKETVMKLAKDFFKSHEPYTKKEQAVFGEMADQFKAFMTNKAYYFDNVIEKMKDLKADFMADGAITLSCDRLYKFVGKLQGTVKPYYADLADWQQTALSKANYVIADLQSKYNAQDEITLAGQEIRDYVGKVSQEFVAELKNSEAIPESHFVAIDKINQIIADKLSYDLVKACDIDALAQAADENVDIQAIVANLS